MFTAYYLKVNKFEKMKKKSTSYKCHIYKCLKIFNSFFFSIYTLYKHKYFALEHNTVDGSISLDSFLKYSKKGYLESHEYYTNLAKNIFKYYDKNNDKILSHSEFKLMTDDLYNTTRLMLFKNKTKSELDKDYKKIDLDSNGKITQNGIT